MSVCVCVWVCVDACVVRVSMSGCVGSCVCVRVFGCLGVGPCMGVGACVCLRACVVHMWLCWRVCVRVLVHVRERV